MKFIFSFIVIFFSTFVFASDYDKHWKQSMVNLVQEFPEKIAYLQTSPEDKLFNLFHAYKDESPVSPSGNFSYYKALDRCRFNYLYRAALVSYYAAPEKKAEIIKQAQNDALKCFEQFDAYRASYQQWNLGKTQCGHDLLDRVYAGKFKP